MTTRRPTLDGAYFEDLYSRSPDPWGFRTSPYERDKYAATLAILPRPRYGAALEVGCSIGVFTRLLAARCDRLLALDASPSALAQARRANADLAHVELAEAVLPGGFPDGRYDLIVLSEVLYYFAEDDLRAVAAQCRAALAPGGQMVLCHWLGETDYPLPGDAAADIFIAASAPQWRQAASRREPEYRLDLLTAAT
ncbi:class I SAM-dependent DNA methyltransferase [Lichenibacterium ramalinae]|uniref:Methyltransferase domain-containing protein n=1 Tax=Lichenibacterium ramalinae TaxID=2316527 RepID=A0A4Q2RFY7_9HYPH|nr:class I SAM-dependent methyltransferase [Lichenibacterium ramalinae]RYB06357.1 methyltransferase domain-containing protein [Lichenibacterium ramalinae]